MLTAWYDENGSADGFQWIVLDSIQIDIPGNNWQMNADSTFGVMLGCSTDVGAIPEEGQVYCDNFYAGPYNELLWPLQVGQVGEFMNINNATDSWESSWEVLEEMTVASNTYYHVKMTNYNDLGDTKDLHIRSTVSTVYFWDVESATEILVFRLGQTGDKWIIDDVETEILGTESVTVPYGGPYNAIEFRKKDISEDSTYWYNYVVPGLGKSRRSTTGSMLMPPSPELSSEYWHQPKRRRLHSCRRKHP